MHVITVSPSTSVGLGDLAYVETTQINGNTVDIQLRDTPSITNRGIKKETGWLGSFTDAAGTTFDHTAHGQHKIVDIRPLRSIEQDYDPYTNEVVNLLGEVYAYEVTFEPV
jgi:hypothetical protein